MEFERIQGLSNFNLFAIFDGYDSLETMWDSIDGDVVNGHLGDSLRENEIEFIRLVLGKNYDPDTTDLTQFYNMDNDEALEDLLVENSGLLALLQGGIGSREALPDPADRPLPGMFQDLHYLLKDLNGYNLQTDAQSDPRWYNTTGDIESFYDDGVANTAHYRTGFYDFLDALSEETPGNLPGVGPSLIPVLESVVNYILDEKVDVDAEDYSDLHDAMDDMISLTTGEDFNDDYVDIMELLSKALIRCDYPIWVDGDGDAFTSYDSMGGNTNTGLGNLVKGVHAIVSGMLQMEEYNPASEEYEPIDREKMYNHLLDVRDNVLRISGTTDLNTEVLKALLTNLEDYFTEGGGVYGTPNDANATITSNIYNSRNNYQNGVSAGGAFYSDAELRNTLKEVVDGQLGVFMREDRDGAVCPDSDSRDYLFQRMAEADTGIDWDNAKIEESLYDLLRYDLFGRDRVTNPSAYPASFIESFLFLGGVTSNLGYKHIDPYDQYSLEVSNSGTANTAQAELRRHGHGEFMGTVSLNDSLQSLTGVRDSLGSIGTYELAFEGSTERWNNIFRSRNKFDQSNKDDYKFRYDYNFPALHFMSGPCVGDMGLPTGGNPDGGDGEALNAYVPYSANGVGNAIPSGWTLGQVMRCTWEGEGPYYYDPEKAGLEGEVVTIGSRAYNVYRRLNGKIYAYIYKPAATADDPSTWEYIFPADGKRDAQETAQYTGSPEFDNSELTTTMTSWPIALSSGGSSGCGGTSEPERYGILIKIGSTFYEPIVFDGSVDSSWTRNDVLAKIQTNLSDSSDDEITVSASGTNAIYISSSKGAITVYDYGDFTIADEDYDPGDAPVYEEIVSPGGLEMFMFNGIADQYYCADAWMELDTDLEVDIEINGTPYNIDYPRLDGASAKEWRLADIISQANAIIGGTHVTQYFNSIKVTGDSSDELGLMRISGSGAEKLFGVEGGDVVKANGRANRYHDTWKTDYYMLTDGNGASYTPIDMSGNAVTAGALTYTELVSEDDPDRACVSQEEALFRNYNFVVNEKKLVLVIPLFLSGTAMGMSYEESVAFQIIETNGWAGLANARKYRDNGVWAKANTGGCDGDTIEEDQSLIPGDYRISVLAQAVDGIVAINASKIYDSTIGRGAANPFVIGANLPALYRLAFPRSNATTAITNNSVTDGSGVTYGTVNFTQDCLSSRKSTDAVHLGFNVSDADTNWQHRNALLPAIIAFFGAIHEGDTIDNHALSRALDGLTPLLKPLFVYNKSLGNNGHSVCFNGWIPRVAGSLSDTDYVVEHSKFISSEVYIDDFVSSTSNSTGYFGGWASRDFYQPAPLPTVMSFLIDSDSSSNRSDEAKRCDGLLPLLCQYTETTEPQTRLLRDGISSLADASDSKYDDDAFTTAELALSSTDFDDQTFAKWGARRKIFYGIEQALTAAKGTKGIYTAINQQIDADHKDERDAYFPNFLFQKRDDDIDLDKALDKIIGPDQPLEPTEPQNVGLAAYTDANQLKEDEYLAHVGAEVDDYLKLHPDTSGYTNGGLVVYIYKRGATAAPVQINSAAGSLTPADISGDISGFSGSEAFSGTISLTLGDGDDEDTDLDDTRIEFTLADGLEDFTVKCDYYFDRADNWDGFEETIDDLDELFTKFIERDDNIEGNEIGDYSIFEPLMDTLDAVFAKDTTGRYTDDQIKGMLYTLGKLLAKYNGTDWDFEGETGYDAADAEDFNKIYRILAYHLPVMHPYLADDTGFTYYCLLKILAHSLQSGDDSDEYGLMQYLMDTANTGSYGWEQVIVDLTDFMVSFKVQDEDSDMWPAMVDLVWDMSKSMNYTTDEKLRALIDRYGFESYKY